MAIKNTERFSELEYCFSQYFNRHLAPVMSTVRSDLQQKQLKEIADYQSSALGFLGAMADASHMMPGMDSTMQRLQVTGEWNSKTTDDYLDMVRKEIAENKSIQKDIAVMASEWRKAVIDEVGREAYDNASRQIGTDLAYAYIDHRLEELMLDRMVSDRMPKSSMEYVIRRAGERSILGLSSLLPDCPADREINERIEARYKPSNLEKSAARGTAFAMDVVTMGGVGSWGSLVKMAGTEVVFAGLEAYSDKQHTSDRQLSVEQCISQGVFGSSTNVFAAFRKDAVITKTWEHPNLIALESQLSRKLGVIDTEPVYSVDEPFRYPLQIKPLYALNSLSTDLEPENDHEGIPYVVAPGKEKEYREERRRATQQLPTATVPPEREESIKAPASAQEAVESLQESTPVLTGDTPAYSDRQKDTNLSGWDGMLQSFGLDGLSATGHNLGYVIAKLPDVLFGALTGKSRNLGLEDNLLPIATVLVGLFVRNPLLKMTLIGLGGANLLNKAGKEALGTHNTQVQPVQPVQSVRYKQYADEPLNDRIAGFSIQGGALLCTIDRVPCTISLPPATVAAYEAGALPLNTLANAVLSRHDAMQDELAHTYQQQYEQARQQGQYTGIR